MMRSVVVSICDSFSGAFDQQDDADHGRGCAAMLHHIDQHENSDHAPVHNGPFRMVVQIELSRHFKKSSTPERHYRAIGASQKRSVFDKATNRAKSPRPSKTVPNSYEDKLRKRNGWYKIDSS